MGMPAVSRDGKFSSWGPGRKQLPEEDEQVLPTILKLWHKGGVTVQHEDVDE